MGRGGDGRVGMEGVRASMEHLYVFTYTCGIALVCICILQPPVYCMGTLYYKGACTTWAPLCTTLWLPLYMYVCFMNME